MTFDGVSARFKIYTPDKNAVTSRAAFCCSTLGDCESWDALCVRLCKSGCLCVVSELPGFGRTPVGAPQDNKTRAGVLWGILDEVEAMRGERDQKWHLVGHGSGCGVVLTMARYQPDSVRSRVLICPTVPRFENRFTRACLTGKIGSLILRRVFRSYYLDPARFENKIRQIYACDVPQEIVERLYREFHRKGRFETLMDSLRYGYTVPAKAWKVPGPLFVLWAAKDIFGKTMPKGLTKKLDDLEYHCYKESGHMFFEDSADDTTDYLSGWIETCEGRQKGPARAGK